MTLKHNMGLTFPIFLEHNKCYNLQTTKTTLQELQDLCLKEFDYAQPRYEPLDKLKGMMSIAYEGHIPSLEDFWASIQDSFEARQRGFYMLTTS